TLMHNFYISFSFFFSSRRRHTRCYRDWSSDVCSSDLFRARTLRVREHMEVRERKRFDESKRRGVILFCLAGEACDCVGADGGMGEVLANEFNTARVVLGTIPAVHGSEDAIRARLQRHVEVLGKPFGRSKELN